MIEQEPFSTMTFTSDFIDEIVRNVMQELRIPTSPSSNDSRSLRSTAAVVESQVITENLLAELNPVDRYIRLQPGAVITPSGRDYIRRHAITVESSTAGETSTTESTGRVWIVGEAVSVASAARSVSWDVAQVTGDFDAANQVAQAGRDVRQVCCSRQPSVIACLLNRNTNRRSAVVTESTCIADLCGAMNPDTVCLSPVGWSFTGLRRLLSQLATTVQPPAAWKELG
jgi:hypothetical protein